MIGKFGILYTKHGPSQPIQARARIISALAVTSSKRVPQVKQYPTIAELGYPGYDSGQWYGTVFPAKTPVELITLAHGQLLTVLKVPDINKRLFDLGYVIIGDQPMEFAAHMKAEIAKLAEALRNVTPE